MTLSVAWPRVSGSGREGVWTELGAGCSVHYLMQPPSRSGGGRSVYLCLVTLPAALTAPKRHGAQSSESLKINNYDGGYLSFSTNCQTGGWLLSCNLLQLILIYQSSENFISKCVSDAEVNLLCFHGKVPTIPVLLDIRSKIYTTAVFYCFGQDFIFISVTNLLTGGRQPILL